MSPEIAQQVVFGITAVGAVVWLWSLNFLVKSARLMQPANQDGFDEPAAKKLLTGSTDVEGDPKALAAKARNGPGQRQLEVFQERGKDRQPDRFRAA